MRFEIKFPILNDKHFIKWKKYFNLKKSFSDRLVKSTYFDTKNLYLAQQNIDGFSSRFKIRERSYNNELSSQIEIKNKNNKYVEKLFFKNFEYSNHNGLVFNDNLNILKKYPKTFFLIKSNKFYKTSTVQYDREYYNISEDIRFTFDKNIIFFNFINSYRTLKKKYNYFILELKTSDYNNEILLEYMQKLNISPKRFSKYIQSLHSFKRAKYY